MHTKKGFTLLELLIVIGILSILSTTIVLVINPAELLKKARDSQRISDLNTIKTAIAYYITEVADPNIGDIGMTYSDVAAVVCTFDSTTRPTGPNQGAFKVDGEGWIPIKFVDITGGSPIGALPRDPAASDDQTGNHYYVYGLLSDTDYTFKLMANMESKYYSTDGDGDVESTDGGTVDTLYEVGTGMSLVASTTATCFNDPGL